MMNPITKLCRNAMGMNLEIMDSVSDLYREVYNNDKFWYSLNKFMQNVSPDVIEAGKTIQKHGKIFLKEMKEDGSIKESMDKYEHACEYVVNNTTIGEDFEDIAAMAEEQEEFEKMRTNFFGGILY